MGKSNGTLKPLRIGLKSVEFLCSLFLIAALYKIGPHWILLLASLAVPIYGIYLIVVKIHPHQSEFAPSMPYLQYKSQLKAKSWLKADMAISLSMCVVTFGFGIVLFFGYFAANNATVYFLESAISSSLLSFLYLFDFFLASQEIRKSSINLVRDLPNTTFSTQTSKVLQLPQTEITQSPQRSPEVHHNVISHHQHHHLPQNSVHYQPSPTITSAQYDFVSRKESSWFDEERRNDSIVLPKTSINKWGPAKENVHENNHYEQRSLRQRPSEELVPGPSNFKMIRQESEEELPPPPKNFQTSRQQPIRIPQRQIESFSQSTDSRNSQKYPVNPIPVNIFSAGSVHPPAYKARMVVVDEDESSFDRSGHSVALSSHSHTHMNNINRKGPKADISASSSDGSTVRMDDVELK